MSPGMMLNLADLVFIHGVLILDILNLKSSFADLLH